MFALPSLYPPCRLIPNPHDNDGSTATTHGRPSQQNGSSTGEAGNGGGSFSHCVEPQTHGSSQGGSSIMCAGGPPSPGGKFDTQVMQDNGGDSSGGGGGGGDGGGGFMGDAVLTMISGSPEYSQQLELEQRRRRQQQHQMQMQQHQQQQQQHEQMQLQHQQQNQHQQQSSSRNSLGGGGGGGGHWPPSQGQGTFTDEWGTLLNRSSTPTMSATTQVPNGFRFVCVVFLSPPCSGIREVSKRRKNKKKYDGILCFQREPRIVPDNETQLALSHWRYFCLLIVLMGGGKRRYL